MSTLTTLVQATISLTSCPFYCFWPLSSLFYTEQLVIVFIKTHITLLLSILQRRSTPLRGKTILTYKVPHNLLHTPLWPPHLSVSLSLSLCSHHSKAFLMFLEPLSSLQPQDLYTCSSLCLKCSYPWCFPHLLPYFCSNDISSEGPSLIAHMHPPEHFTLSIYKVTKRPNHPACICLFVVYVLLVECKL